MPDDAARPEPLEFPKRILDDVVAAERVRDQLAQDPSVLAAIREVAKTDQILRGAIERMGIADYAARWLESISNTSVISEAIRNVAIGLDASASIKTAFANLGAITHEQLKGVAEEAAKSAVRMDAFELASIRDLGPLESSETIALREVEEEVRGLARIMSEAARNTEAQARIADAMLAGIRQLGEKNEELLEESQALRSTLTAGQDASDKLGGRVLRWTRVLLILTVVLAFLAVPVAIDSGIRVARLFGWLPPEP